MLPLSLDVRTKRGAIPWGIVGVAIVCFIILVVEFVVDAHGIDPWDIFAFQSHRPDPGRLLLSAYSHASIMHWFGNMFFLWVFGAALEDRLGWRRFLVLYAVCGVLDTLLEEALYLALHGGDAKLPPHYSLGASGAVCAVMGMTQLRFLRARVCLSFDAFGPFTVAAKVFKRFQWWVPLWAFTLWYFGREVMRIGDHDGVGHLAHLLGFVCGALAGAWVELDRAGADEQLELQAEAALETGSLRRARDLYRRLQTKFPQEPRYRFALLESRIRARAKPVLGEVERKEIANGLEKALELCLLQGNVALAVERYQAFIPPLAPEDFSESLRERLAEGRQRVRVELSSRFTDEKHRQEKVAAAIKALKIAVMKRDSEACFEAAVVLKGLLDLDQWPPELLLPAARAILAAGLVDWDALAMEAVWRAGVDEGVSALVLLEREWFATPKHGRLSVLLRQMHDKRPELASDLRVAEMALRVSKV